MTADTHNGSDHGPLFAWPDAPLRRRLIAAAVWLSLLFVVVYGGTDYITSVREARFPIDFAFESSLPFVPELSVVYSSLYLMYVVVVLALRTCEELNRFVVQMSCMTLFAGVCFLIFPAELSFIRPEVTGWAAIPFGWADQINLTYNCAPSLHVAYAVLCAETMRRKQWKAGLLLHLWAIAVAASAWLTYQHHLVDLITGYLLGGWFGRSPSSRNHLELFRGRGREVLLEIDGDDLLVGGQDRDVLNGDPGHDAVRCSGAEFGGGKKV